MAIMIWITVIGIVVGSASLYDANRSVVNSTDHVCSREETYTEQIRVPVRQEVKVRSSTWCLEIPPRCSDYKTEMREVVKLQNVTRTKYIEYCCEGYAEITIANETICKPICRGGCGRGICYTPNECHCDPGYIGRHCTHRCQLGRWGEGCRFVCKCRNGALCDNRTGKCQCKDGWIGSNCELSCPEGFHGWMCNSHCECSSKRCDPVTGECIPEDGEAIDETFVISQNSPMKISIASNSTSSDSSLIIESLNSSIANLTENIDKLTKNLNLSNSFDSITAIVPNTMIEITTEKTLQEVMVLKPNDVASPLSNYEMQTSIEKISHVVQKTGSSDVIHVTGDLQHNYLLGFSSSNGTAEATNANTNSQRNKHFVDNNGPSNGVNAVLVVIAIFSIALLACGIGFLLLYRRHLQKNNELKSNDESTKKTLEINAKTLPKPLPDLPAFTQNIARQSYVPEFYDRPSNNTAVNNSPAESKYSGYISNHIVRPISKPFAQKGSVEHLYDEIKYNSKSECSRV